MAEKKILDKQKREHQNYDSILLLNKNGTLDPTKPSFRNNSLRYRGFLRLNRKKVSRIGGFLLIIYFLCIYAILFGIMTGLLIIVLQLFISEDKPYLTGLQSPLNLAPGLSHRPNINFMTSLIAYESSNPQSYMPYVQNLRTFFSLYEEVNIKPQDGFATCENGVKTPNIPRLVCKFYPILLESCVKENNFGYDRSEPCVVIKINKVYGWLPDIQNTSMSQSPLLRCFGRYESNFEVFGSLHYYPNVTIDGIVYGIFDSVYFPYIIQYAYRSPVVAVQVKNVQRNGLFFLTCRLFNLNTPTEPLNFEFLID
ncbi:Sodium/potassium-transporting ATPase subunit beta-1 [Echinococcus granulosus]|uniref:Sodium/potassium-transporting ATPase subunit beta-1 n=1 Tax=Echinococcus granulosus TaxID=6210 RepID=W6UWL8_ECHGR|nr:Sodium/potassium-transporting ATPase subunit beta-1 [Echinococcus granulosus]EUB62877.1 Sodium/potassium-transporting ATPase subunit beta-1 [Echinococcus granulosus]